MKRLRITGFRVLAVLGAGVTLYFANPPRTTWWLAPLAFAVVCMVCRGQRARAGIGYGLLFGLGWMLPLFRWLWDFLGPGYGPWPWLAVSAVCAVQFALPCSIIALTSRHWAGPFFAAASVVAGEAIRLRWPIGGFPWARFAFSQPDGPLVRLAAWGGAPLVSFAVALTGAAIATLWAQVAARHTAAEKITTRLPQGYRCPTAGSAGRLKPMVLTLLLLATPMAFTVAASPPHDQQQPLRSLRVLVIQGSGPNIGLELINAGDVLWRRNLAETRRVAHDLAVGHIAKPDVVVMGESVARVASTRHDDLGALAQLAALVHAPVVVGSISSPQQGPAYNVALGYDPELGKIGEYVKHHLAPYGEFFPLKSVARLFTPFVEYTKDLTPGHAAGLIRAGGARLGVAICFDVAYDDVLRQATNAGADVLTVPTNNAWFGDSEMTYQQQAMARLRAVEHDRAVVVASTTGSSAVITPDGRVSARTAVFEPTSMSGEVPLRSGSTVADRLGAWSEGCLSALGASGLVFGLYRQRSTRQRRSADEQLPGPSIVDSE